MAAVTGLCSHFLHYNNSSPWARVRSPEKGALDQQFREGPWPPIPHFPGSKDPLLCLGSQFLGLEVFLFPSGDPNPNTEPRRPHAVTAIPLAQDLCGLTAKLIPATMQTKEFTHPQA